MMPRYEDRSHAGRVLAERLAPLLTRPCVVVGIPRGGVVVAEAVAERLQMPLAVIRARKLTDPSAPELAFGALTDEGTMVLDRETLARLGLGARDVERARTRVAGEMRHGRALYRDYGLKEHGRGVQVVLVDDGLATGLTLRAAVLCAYRQGASDITLAVPCAADVAAVRLHLEVDGVVCPVVDPQFVCVAQYYADFSPVTEEEVLGILAFTRSRWRARAVEV